MHLSAITDQTAEQVYVGIWHFSFEMQLCWVQPDYSCFRLARNIRRQFKCVDAIAATQLQTG